LTLTAKNLTTQKLDSPIGKMNLVRVLIAWIFRNMGEVEKIIHKRGKWGTQPHFLKKGNLDLDFISI
jgi:hypothetical protein